MKLLNQSVDPAMLSNSNDANTQHKPILAASHLYFGECLYIFGGRGRIVTDDAKRGKRPRAGHFSRMTLTKILARHTHADGVHKRHRRVAYGAVPADDFDFGRISAKLRLQLAPRIESGCRRGDLSSDSAEKEQRTTN